METAFLTPGITKKHYVKGEWVKLEIATRKSHRKQTATLQQNLVANNYAVIIKQYMNVKVHSLHTFHFCTSTFPVPIWLNILQIIKTDWIVSLQERSVTDPFPLGKEITINGREYADADLYLDSMIDWVQKLTGLPSNDHIMVFTGQVCRFTQTFIIIHLRMNSTVKPVISDHSKRRPKIGFKTDYHFMQVKSIAECSKRSILQYFRPSVSYHLSLRYLFCLFLSGRLWQVLLYMWVSA